MSKWDSFRSSLGRVHDDMGYPTATVENWTGATLDKSGDMTGGTWESIGTIDVELVPPSIDSSVSIESGTELGFDTSLRAPQSDVDALSQDLVPYGEDAEKPTRITVEGTTYELQGNRPEDGSGMVMLRVTEK